uniref:Putative ovule protein n=1 Tax=Solanum chacoense TaxID=4108 RepID=A0A0V0I2G2_SOLCH
MIVNDELEFTVVGKFSYRWPDIQDLRRLIPKQCDLKGEVNIGLLSNRYVLIKASRMEDYVNLLSKPIFYIAHKNWNYPMRTLKWYPLFDPKEETAVAIAWISLPSLPPLFFLEKRQSFQLQQQWGSLYK